MIHLFLEKWIIYFRKMNHLFRKMNHLSPENESFIPEKWTIHFQKNESFIPGKWIFYLREMNHLSPVNESLTLGRLIPVNSLWMLVIHGTSMQRYLWRAHPGKWIIHLRKNESFTLGRLILVNACYSWYIHATVPLASPSGRMNHLSPGKWII